MSQEEIWSWFAGFNWLDLLLALIVLWSTVASFVRGFTKEVVSLLAVVVGLVMGCWFYGVAGSFLLPFVKHAAFANIAGFFLVFIVCLLIGALIGFGLTRVLDFAHLSWVNRLVGAGFGLVRGALVGIVILLGISAFAPEPPPESVVHSRLAPYLMGAARVAAWMAPREFRNGFDATHDRVREIWRESVKPALQSLSAGRG
jgi:membrane protein required for colicin V production